MTFLGCHASSPVVALHPQPALHSPYERSFFKYELSTFSQPAARARQEAPISSLAGRKRSRDEAAVNLDSPEKTIEPPVIKEAEDEWIYGPGMALIKKSTRYVADACSRFGTWVEEAASKEEALRAEEALLLEQQRRPSLRSNKSQRLELATTSNELSSGGRTILVSPSSEGSSSPGPDGLSQPIVDKFTMLLGIGWCRIGQTDSIQAAARGWARYIENHYPLTDVNIQLESRGLQSYLVEAMEGYFLFAENLRQGRLVSKDSQRALHSLKSTPVVFDGANTMDAADSPKPASTAPPSFFDTPATDSTPIEMDMS